MRRFWISLLTVLISAGVSFAQDISFSFDFTYTLDTRVPVNGAGSVVLQNNCYHVVLDGVNYWCDGQTCWIVDDESKEVYVDYPADYSEYLKTAEISYSGKAPSQVVIKMKDGARATLSVKNYVLDPTVTQPFAFNTENLSSDYIVTDIR